MSLINEKRILREWIYKQSPRDDEWNTFHEDVESYWKMRRNTEGIEIFDISSLADIQKRLRDMWQKEENEEIEKVLSVAALKSCKDDIEEEIYLTDFVYVF